MITISRGSFPILQNPTADILNAQEICIPANQIEVLYSQVKGHTDECTETSKLSLKHSEKMI